MTDRRHPIREIDLLAYADGLLDADSERKAEVEDYLRKHPEAAAKVRDYTDQNNALRRLYGPVAAEPVPERLKAILEHGSRSRLGYVGRAALVASLLLAVGYMGWLIGKRGQSDPWLVQDFVEQVMTAYVRPHLASGPGSDRSLEGATQPFHGLLLPSASQLQPPPLTQQGFTLIDKHLMTANGSQTAQVTYAAPGGRRLSLFLRPRWQEEAPQFHFTENEGVTMVYWLEGPLVYALVGQLDRQEMLAVVKAVRRSIHHQPQDAMPQILPSGVPQGPHVETERTPAGNDPLVSHDLPAPISPVQRVTRTD
jgi:anti-sigma factor RsiW